MAVEHCQIFGNVGHMSWFVEAVAAWLSNNTGHGRPHAEDV